MHQSISPAILYLGTPVVLVSTVNENGSYNLAPMSSAFWLGWRCMLGFEGVSKTRRCTGLPTSTARVLPRLER
jgi:flavin reductase (DIM6/NTAB) family NADH-FMN oxidoreductase RutF